MKYVPVIVIVLLIIIGGSFFYLSQKNKVAPQGASTVMPTSGSMFTSIKDALSKSLSLTCDYTDEKGVETKTFVKAGAVRVETAKTDMIMKDKKIYSWDPTTKVGTMMVLPDRALTPQAQPSITMKQGTPPASGENNQESVLAEIEKFKNACKPATVDDALFVPPTDVKFQDLSTMMKQFQAPPQVPSGAMPSGYNLDDLKKQYMPQGQ